jgi:hypothetical protein
MLLAAAFNSVYHIRLINLYSTVWKMDIFCGISGWILHTVCSLQYVKLGVGFFFFNTVMGTNNPSKDGSMHHTFYSDLVLDGLVHIYSVYLHS